MKDINLVTENKTQINLKKTFSVNVGVIVGLSLLLITLIIYGALYFYNSYLKGQVADTYKKYKDEITFLTSEKNLEIFDFQNRIELSKKIIAEENSPKNLLEIIENDMVPGVYLSSLNYDKTTKILELDCVANGLNSFIQQIASFKKDENFVNVTTEGAKINSDTLWLGNIKIVLK